MSEQAQTPTVVSSEASQTTDPIVSALPGPSERASQAETGAKDADSGVTDPQWLAGGEWHIAHGIEAWSESAQKAVKSAVQEAAEIAAQKAAESAAQKAAESAAKKGAEGAAQKEAESAAQTAAAESAESSGKSDGKIAAKLDGFTLDNETLFHRHRKGYLQINPRSKTATLLFYSRVPSMRWAMDGVHLEGGTFHVLQDGDPDQTDDPTTKNNPKLPVQTAPLTECKLNTGSTWDDWRLVVELQHAYRTKPKVVTWEPVQSFKDTPVPDVFADKDEIDGFLRTRMEHTLMAGWFKKDLHPDQTEFCQRVPLPSREVLAEFYNRWAYDAEIPSGSVRPVAGQSTGPLSDSYAGLTGRWAADRNRFPALSPEAMSLASRQPLQDPLGFLPGRPGLDSPVSRRRRTFPTPVPSDALMPYNGRPGPSFPSTYLPRPPPPDFHRPPSSSMRPHPVSTAAGRAPSSYRGGTMPDAHLPGPARQNMTYVFGGHTTGGEGSSWHRPSPFSFAANMTQEDFGHPGGGNAARPAGLTSTNTGRDSRQRSRPFAPTPTPDAEPDSTQAPTNPRPDRSAIRQNATRIHDAWVAAKSTPSGPSGPSAPGPGSREVPLEIGEDPPRNDFSPASTSASASGRGGRSLLRYVSSSTHTPVADDPDPEEPALFPPPPRSATWPTRAPGTPSQRELMPPPPRPQGPSQQAQQDWGSDSTSQARPSRKRLPDGRRPTGLAYPAFGTQSAPYTVDDEADATGHTTPPTAAAVTESVHSASPLRMPAVGEIQPETGPASPSSSGVTWTHDPDGARPRYARLGPVAIPRVDDAHDQQEESSASAGGLRGNEDRAASSQVEAALDPLAESSIAASGHRDEDDVEADSGVPSES